MGPAIVEAVRSAVGKRKGGLAGVHPADLSAAVAGDIARTALLSAGWPETVTGVTIDRQCGLSQQALSFAVAVVESGYHDVVVAGGVESMTRVPMGSSVSRESFPYGAKYMGRNNGIAPNQGVGAEMIAERWGFTRTQLDEFAVASHDKAAAAQGAGFFAGNASQIADGSAAIPVMSEEAAAGPTRPSSSCSDPNGFRGQHRGIPGSMPPSMHSRPRRCRCASALTVASVGQAYKCGCGCRGRGQGRGPGPGSSN